MEKLKNCFKTSWTTTTRKFINLKCLYFFAFSTFILKNVYMPLYFKQVGLPATYTGLLSGLPPFVRGGGAILFGILADKLRKRRTVFLVSLVANTAIPLVCLIPRVQYPSCEATSNGTTLHESTDNDKSFGNWPVFKRIQCHYASLLTMFDPHLLDIEKFRKINDKAGRNTNEDNNAFNFEEEKQNEMLYVSLVQSKDSIPTKQFKNNDIKSWTKHGKTNLTKLNSYGNFHDSHKDVTLDMIINKRNITNNPEFYGSLKKENVIDSIRNLLGNNGYETTRSVKVKSYDPLDKDMINMKADNGMTNEKIISVFLTLLVLLLIGEFLGGPLRSLADMCVLETMGGDKSNYGDVALWLQVGKIFLAFTILFLIQRYPLPLCDRLIDNYEYSLYPLAAFSAFSLIFALNIRFQGDYEEGTNVAEDHLDRDKTLCDVLFTFEAFTILVLSLFAGAFRAVQYTFTFWYLTDLSPKNSAVVIAVLLVLRDVSAVISYKGSTFALAFAGPVNTLHVALLLNFFSFLTYGLISNPWLAVIPEILQYIVLPLSYSCFVVYLDNVTPSYLNATIQGIFQCLYFGAGYGAGPIAGGILIDRVGGANTFLLFALFSFIILVFSLCRHGIIQLKNKY